MTDQQDQQTHLLKLYRPAPGATVEVCEISRENLASHASTRAANAREIRELIEELLEHLPEDERQTFKQRIKTEGMI